MKRFLFGLLCLLILFLSVYLSLAISVDDLNGKLSDPVFSRLPKGAIVDVEVYGSDWGDYKDAFYYERQDYGFLRGALGNADFTVGVKEEFLDTVLQVSDLCAFASGLPRNPDQYRILAYDWWGFIWKYKCFSASSCLEKYCEG